MKQVPITVTDSALWVRDDYSRVRLVRGVGRRSIKVFFPYTTASVEDDRVAIRAARLAAKKGWRKIVVVRDNMYGETLRGFNMHQYHHERWGYERPGFFGAYLGYVEGYND